MFSHWYSKLGYQHNHFFFDVGAKDNEEHELLHQRFAGDVSYEQFEDADRMETY